MHETLLYYALHLKNLTLSSQAFAYLVYMYIRLKFHTFCTQIHRYNVLLATIRTSLVELEKGIKGLVVMSSDLEEVFTCIYNAQVPPLWSKAFPSLKPLGAWTRDLVNRVEQFSTWATTTHPPVLFWLSGFTFPTGFLTAVLQTAARKNNVCTHTYILLNPFLVQISAIIIDTMLQKICIINARQLVEMQMCY